MRQAIITFLKTNLSSVGHYQPEVVTKETTKPYTVLRKSNETEMNISQAKKRYFNIYCCTEKGNYNDLDNLVETIINELNNTELTTDNNIVFKLIYNGFIGTEYYDQDFDINTQGLLFSTEALYL